MLWWRAAAPADAEGAGDHAGDRDRDHAATQELHGRQGIRRRLASRGCGARARGRCCSPSSVSSCCPTAARCGRRRSCARSARSASRSATPARPSPGSPSRARSARSGRAARPAGTSPTQGRRLLTVGHGAHLRLRRRRRRLGRAVAGRAVLGARGAAGEAPPAAQPARLRRVRLPRPRRRRLAPPRPGGRRPTPCSRTSTSCPGAVVLRAETGEPASPPTSCSAGRGTSTRSPPSTSEFLGAFERRAPRDRRRPGFAASSSSSTPGGGSRSSTPRSRRGCCPPWPGQPAKRRCSTTATPRGRRAPTRWYEAAEARRTDQLDTLLDVTLTDVCRINVPAAEGGVAPAVITFDTDPSAYRHWELDDRRARRHADDAGHARRRPARRLRAEAQQLRPRRRHRAARRRAAAALRAPRGQGGRRHRRARQGVLRRRQHPDARRVDARPQGQLLQVHQRDPQRHRGRHRPLRPGLDRRRQRHGRRRRLRAGAGLRRDHPRRRPRPRRSRCPRCRCWPCCPAPAA